MKIHSTHLCISEIWRNDRQAYRLLTLCGAVALCIMTCTSVNAQSRLFANSSASQTESSSMVRNGLFINGDQSYPVVNTAAFRTAADIGTPESGSIAQVGFGGACNSCGTSCGGSCGNSHSSCRSCGTNCGGRCGPYGRCGNVCDPCAPCNPYWYVMVETLYMERSGQNVDYSRDFRLGDYDYEWAPRITIGSVPDCVHGYEASFTGQFTWDLGRSAVDPGFGLGTLLTPGLPVAAADLSAFSNADFQRHEFEAEYWSLEASETTVGWGIAKLITGFRYINYEERLAYYSQNVSQAGLLASSTRNQLYGLQVGMDLLYPICKHGYTDFRSRFGAFVNYAESNVLLDNAGVRVLATDSDKTKLAGLIEIGSGLRYQIGEMLSVRGGVEFMYLTRVASAPEQIASPIIRPSTGLGTRMKEELFLFGLSVGAELRY